MVRAYTALPRRAAKTVQNTVQGIYNTYWTAEARSGGLDTYTQNRVHWEKSIAQPEKK